ncbi:MAG: phosphotransferase family protein, partial [Opitutales bacterium]
MDSETEAFRELLLREGILTASTATLTPLTGGVSSEIYRADNGGRTFVVKRALAKLRVAVDWYADPGRSRTEQAYIRFVAGFRPDAVPQLIEGPKEAEYFCMEFLDGFANWKQDMLKGRCDLAIAETTGALLGEIHRQSWGNPEAARTFDTLNLFDQLRLDPYLRATAAKHPELSEVIHAEVERLRQKRECLVHGDFSPKNLLHREGRVVALDCETAVYGDPAFDLAFLLNHLFLKSLQRAPSPEPWPEMIEAAFAGYERELPGHFAEVDRRTSHLLPMLTLARVDGKSPVEYLTDEAKRDFVRRFVTRELL